MDKGNKWKQQKGRGYVHLSTQQPIENLDSSQPKEFNKEEVEQLRVFLNTLGKTPGIRSLTYSGQFPISIGLNASNSPLANFWVLHSRATGLMTHSSQNFSTYHPCPSTRKITTADGSLITGAGLGDIPINRCIALKEVLHVPKMSSNLISIKKLTQDLNCTVIFCSNYCEFPDQTSGRTIGRAKERDGLYYLYSPNNLNLV